MQSFLRVIRERFHPLHYARKLRVGRLLIGALDHPTWLEIPSIAFRIRGLRITHGLSYGLLGMQESRPRALALACLKQFCFQSFWDVGANFGYYSWLLKSADPDLKTILVEPLPKNARLIRETINDNLFANAYLFEAGASDRVGEGILHQDTLAGSTSSLNDDETFEQRHYGISPNELRVPLISLDSIRAMHGPAEFVKIDVEGHEDATLSGASETIHVDRPVFFIECMHHEHRCLDILASAGYGIIDADFLSVNCTEESSNFFCLPPQKKHLAEEVLGLARSYDATLS